MTTLPWIQVLLEAHDDGTLSVSVPATSDRRSLPSRRVASPTVSQLQAFTQRMAEMSASGAPADADNQRFARMAWESIFDEDLGELIANIRGGSEGRILIRLFVSDPTLRGVPWEALRGPSDKHIEVGCHPRIRMVRGVYSSEPSMAREVDDAVRLLVVAPDDMQESLHQLRTSLSGRIVNGQLAWLPPAIGPDARFASLLRRMNSGLDAHILHIICHGRVRDGEPELLLDPSGDNWVQVSVLATALEASSQGDLRLVFLESCSGADPGALASAAERLGAAGIEAVVAHLWPVRRDTARMAAEAFYDSLVSANEGDVSLAINAARLLLAGSVGTEAFCPVLYLHGTDPVVLDMSHRRTEPRRTSSSFIPKTVDSDAGIEPLTREESALLDEIEGLLTAQSTFIVGSVNDPTASDDTLPRMEEELANILGPSELRSLSERMQQLQLAHSRQEVTVLVQSVFNAIDMDRIFPPGGILDKLSTLAGPGLYVTLLWLPLLEELLAKRSPHMDLYVFQPLKPSGLDTMHVYLRRAHQDEWERMRKAPDRIDYDNAIVVLRLFGGYTAGGHMLYGDPVLTDDDHLEQLEGLDALPAQMVAHFRNHPLFAIGVAPLNWRHRQLLRRLSGNLPLAAGSMAVVPSEPQPGETEYWHQVDGPGGRARSVRTIRFDELSGALRKVSV